MKKRLFNSLISFFILIILLFVTDYLLGVMYEDRPKEYIPQRHIYLREHSPGEIYTFQQPLGFFERDKSIEGKREVRFVIDEKGFLEPSNLLADSDISIAFMGGSTTECSSVTELKRFPYLVGQLLNQQGWKVNTMNAGVSKNNSSHSLNIYINKVFVEEPDIAVMMHNINDLNHLMKEKRYWHSNGVPTHIISPPIRSLKTALIANMKSVFPNIGLRFDRTVYNLRAKSSPEPKARKIPRPTEEDMADIFRQFRENLNLFISISRIKGITPVLMTQGSRIKTDFVGIERMKDFTQSSMEMPLEEYKVLYAEMNQIIRDVCKEQGVLMIDLDKISLPEHIYDAVHYNDTGSEFVAGKIADQLAPLVEEIVKTNSGQ